MYYIVYGLLYLVSLLPFRVLYFISDIFYYLLYYVIGYRKDVVMNNLKIAFPEKTDAERLKIARKFYSQFVDNFIEMLKLLSISKKTLEKRFKVNIEVLNDLKGKIDKVQVVTGHYFNWEFANSAVGHTSLFPFIVVYMPVKNKVFDKLVYKLRSRFGTILVPATAFRTNFHQYIKDEYALILVADQNAGHVDNAYWLPFFGKMAPFVRGPERGAIKNNTAVIYAHFYPYKRGYYTAKLELITTTPREYAEGELTKILVKKVEDSVKEIPSSYLWTHKRWKWEFDPTKHKAL
ncbi:MAG: lipid A biosynthesis acyltransferase [Filimonas sp.]|nr:lipid A biosynthesis acyltransferase [Filimonas sp.]